MKNLKFLVTFIVVMAFFAFNSYSQKPIDRSDKTVDSWEECVEGYPFPCLGENITGCEVYTFKFWPNQAQLKVKGTFTGDDTGTVYYFSWVFNFKGVLWIPGGILMGTETKCLEDEYGNVYYTYHHNDHQTLNANGEIPVEFWKEHTFWSCEF
ncbi:MAG TPA: hypothetical protein VEP89_02250 [Draconibacterium sp.]|nr:hypothetical protein [Draconibacterium sp.]